MTYFGEFLQDFSNQSQSTTHHALRSSRRRLVVVLVANELIENYSQNPGDDCHIENKNNTELTVREISRKIVSIEKNIPEENATGDPYHNVYTSLIQSHLPRLDAVSAINYNSDRKTIQPDRNLIALAVTTATTSPLVHIFFQPAITDMYAGGSKFTNDSITD